MLTQEDPAEHQKMEPRDEANLKPNCGAGRLFTNPGRWRPRTPD